MNVSIEIHYISDSSKSLQKGTFQLRGQKPEQVALDFWKQIKREMSHRAELEKVIVEGDKDITQLVIDLEKQAWKNTLNDDLPF